MLDCEADAGRRANRPLADDLTSFQAEFAASSFIGGAGDERRLTYRGDGGQRFAAKTEGSDVFQVCGGAKLGGGMALESQSGFGGGDAATIVNDPQQAFAPALYLHSNIGPGIDAVLDQLLGRRGRALDDFTGCNFVGHIGRKNMNGHGGIITDTKIGSILRLNQ